jgi:ABC-type Na+ efflux pump permease subunit
VRPVEVMIAKIVPYIGIGYVQVRLILAFGLFIASNLAFDFTIWTLARNQMPGDPAGTVHAFAVDPAVGLSLPVPRLADLGAMDRRGVPDDAHPAGRPWCYLKGNTGAEILPSLWPITVFTLIIAAIAIWYYRGKVD